MTENEVRDIASKYVADQHLDHCQIASVRRFARNEISEPETIGDEWVVQVQFDSEEDMSGQFGMIIVDDATGIPHLFECL